ncbi:hypothetical protein [Sphingomonas lacusdianchii]|uniref:hypothetical protein n=1 Tax=Sphingomonas lacusdianchii TaxID=2917992 RepID=UPI001F5A20E3|nr:hypothetical protein [Sphingomonas sp. JXJ CY 53]
MSDHASPPAAATAGTVDPHVIARRLAHAGSDSVARRYLRGEAREAETGASRLAMARVDAALGDLRYDVDDRLQRIFRDHVGATVRTVSPLVLDACEAEGLDLDEAVEGVRYDDYRYAWSGGPASMRGLASPPARSATSGMPTRIELLSRFRRCGVVVRGRDDPLGALGFRIGAACLEISMLTSGARMVSSNGGLYLTLDGPVPETLRMAAPGRCIDDLVEHALLSGRGYRVLSVSEDHRGRTLIVAWAAPVPWSMPWAREASV